MAVTYFNRSLSLPRDSCSLRAQIVPSVQLEVHWLQVQCNDGGKHICDRNVEYYFSVFIKKFHWNNFITHHIAIGWKFLCAQDITACCVAQQTEYWAEEKKQNIGLKKQNIGLRKKNRISWAEKDRILGAASVDCLSNQGLTHNTKLWGFDILYNALKLIEKSLISSAHFIFHSSLDQVNLQVAQFFCFWTFIERTVECAII